MATLNSTPTNVVSLPRKSTKTKTRSAPRPLIALRRQRNVGLGMLAAALLLSVLSTKHQISGLMLVTGDSYTAILALVIEVGYLMCELAKLVLVGKTEVSVKKTLMVMLIGLLVLSATMNAFAFSITATADHQVVAIAFGILVPILVYGFARVGGPMILAHR
jgi:hypothetical protein